MEDKAQVSSEEEINQQEEDSSVEEQEDQPLEDSPKIHREDSSEVDNPTTKEESSDSLPNPAHSEEPTLPSEILKITAPLEEGRLLAAIKIKEDFSDSSSPPSKGNKAVSSVKLKLSSPIITALVSLEEVDKEEPLARQLKMPKARVYSEEALRTRTREEASSDRATWAGNLQEEEGYSELSRLP